jgi:DNA repair ATPase RecN
MTIIKRNRVSSTSDLVAAIQKLCPLLESQKEFDAVADLKKASDRLRKATENDPEWKTAIRDIIEAFEGEHELMAYTLQRDSDQWTEVEELSQLSSRVLSLARRLTH